MGRRAVFFGSGGFAIPVLDALVRAPEVDVVGVVTAPPRPSGRRGELAPTPVATRAAELHLPVLAPARLRSPDVLDQLRGLDPGVGVLSDYGKILPVSVLDLPRAGVLNLHPSLLPRHRGATPIPAAILAGDTETGVTLFRMDEGMDTGPLVAQVRTALGPAEDAPALEARLAHLAGDLLARCLGPWLAGSLPAVPQPAEGVTVTRPLRRDDGRLDPGVPAPLLERAIRAHRPWPGSFIETGAGRLVVEDALAAPADVAAGPGAIVVAGALPALVTSDGWLVLRVVRPAGGRAMRGDAWLRGRPGLAGSRVG